MKQYISKYSDPAKTLLAAIAMLLVTGGYYDAATAQMLVGVAMGIGTAFWQLYDLATTKRLVKETTKPATEDDVHIHVAPTANFREPQPYAIPNKVM